MSSFRDAVEWAQKNTPRAGKTDSHQNNGSNLNNPGPVAGQTPTNSTKPNSSGTGQESSWTSIFRSIWFWVVLVVVILIVCAIIYFVYYQRDPDEKVFIEDKEIPQNKTEPINLTGSTNQFNGKSQANSNSSSISGIATKSNIGPVPIPLTRTSPLSTQNVKSSNSSGTIPNLIKQDGRTYEMVELTEGQAPPEGFVEMFD